MAKKSTFRDAIPEAFAESAKFSDRAMTPEDVQNSFTSRLFYSQGIMHQVTYKSGTPLERSWCTGMTFDSPNEGPRRQSNVMVVTPYPVQVPSSISSVFLTRAISDVCYSCLSEQAAFAGLEDCSSWYFTPLIKFALPEGVGTVIPAEWKHYCFPWLMAEIRRVLPEYIICIGSHATKEILGNRATLDGCYDRLNLFTFEYSDGFTHTAKIIVLPAMSDTNEEARQEATPRIRKQLKFMRRDMFKGADDIKERVRHVVAYTPEDVKNEVDRVIALNQNVVAVDLEWEGDYPDQPGAHALTFQFSTLPGEATVCVLGDRSGYYEDIQARLSALLPLLIAHDNWVPRLGGHFLRADLPWILSMFPDVDTKKAIMKSYAPADTPEECWTKGGWDTALMLHAVREDRKSYSLKELAELLIGLDSWDVELSDFLSKYIADNKMKKSDLHGFGCIPPEILYPYGAWDADATRRLFAACVDGYMGHPALLRCDAYGHENIVPFWRAHSASLPLLEMEMTGFVLDKDRLDVLSELFKHAYDAMLEYFRCKINWPDFNPQSTRHKQGYLFGRDYTKTSKKESDKQDSSLYAMPEDAETLGLTPLYCTGSKQDWETLDTSEFSGYMPASDAMTLAILSLENSDVRLLYDICKLGNTLKSSIRPPVKTIDEAGNTVNSYDAGIYTYMHPDGKVHTRLKQMLKTGRLSSTEPNLQNISKSAEATLLRILGTTDAPGDYEYIFGGDTSLRYRFPMRTILKAEPGRVLIESDFTGAELAVMAWVSGDENMIEHVRRNALSEDDPDFYDIHSNIAVKAFKLACEPTKHGLASIGKKHLRVAAKAVVFGIPYGRGVKAILNQLKSQGVILTLEEGQNLLNSYFQLYPKTKGFLDYCKFSVTEYGYVQSVFGRYRRFPNYAAQYKKRNPFFISYGEFAAQTGEPYYVYRAKNAISLSGYHNYLKDAVNEEVAKYGREACNAPIQSAVADSVNMALRNLWQYRDMHPELDFKLHMQIHDALVVSVPMEQAEEMLRVMQLCMVDNNPLFIPDPITGEVHERRFAIDSDLYYHWGETITLDKVKQDLVVNH